MMIILDTNVLSELMKSQPKRLVVDWIAKHKTTNLFITALTQAEILYGLEILNNSQTLSGEDVLPGFVLDLSDIF